MTLIEEVKQNLPKFKTYWELYSFCKEIIAREGLNSHEFNILGQQARELFLQRR